MTTALGVRLEIQRLGYHGQDLFRDFEADLPAGKWTALLGASGVGKSTLLRLVAGLEPQDSQATVRLSDGGAPTGRIALMGQTDLLLPWLTVRDNVALGARLRGEDLSFAREQAAALLSSVGLEAVADRKPPALSGGMRQRTALARTLAENRPVVLMDEPFSQLDAITRHSLQALAADLLRGRTVCMVTHDPAEALRLGDAVWTLSGSPARLLEQPPPPGVPPRARSAELSDAEARLLKTLGGDSDP